jgi:hypothetical protein
MIMKVVIPAKAGIQLKGLLPAGRQGIPDQVRNDVLCKVISETVHYGYYQRLYEKLLWNMPKQNQTLPQGERGG